MKHRRYVLAARASIVLVAVAMILVLLSNVVVAGPGLKIVQGYVKDSEGNRLVGASVLIEIIRPDKTVRSSFTMSTNSTGGYRHTFAASDWEINDKINVTTDFSGNVANNWTTATNSAGDWVNVTYTYEIPEFGSSTGLLVAAGAIGLVACVALLWTRRKQ